MSGFHKRLIHGLDSAAARTGVPALSMRMKRRRHMRWLPLVALSFASALMAFALVRPDQVGICISFLGACSALTGVFAESGPLKLGGAAERIDEFDRIQLRNALFKTFATISIIAFIGMLLIGGLALASGWTKFELVMEIVALAVYLALLYAALPTLYASWATDPIADDE